MEQMPSKLSPALIGGAIMAVLSSTPVISAGNCICCMWILLGGMMAGYYYSKSLPPGIEYTSSDGAVVGLLAGVFGALFSTFIQYLMQYFGLQTLNFIDKILESGQDIPAEVEQMMREWQDKGGLNMAFAMMMLISGMLFDSLFGMLGGLLSVKFFKNNKPPRETQTTIL